MLFKSASDGETIGGETMSLRRKKTVACPKCNKESDYLFWESLNGDLDPEAKTQLIDGTFFQFKGWGGFSVASQGFARYRETPWLQHFAGIAIFGVSMEAGGNL